MVSLCSQQAPLDWALCCVSLVSKEDISPRFVEKTNMVSFPQWVAGKIFLMFIINGAVYNIHLIFLTSLDSLEPI
jgi:hypothetical protein